jgi:threonine dehydrogenase-like Zn-dependent dehydrogenase
MNGKRISACSRDNIRLESFELPETLQPNEMLLETHYSLVSPGTEIYCASNASADSPAYLGYTSVGTIVATGEAKKDWLGKNVFVFPSLCHSHSAHATAKLISPECLTVEIPKGVNPESALFARFINIALTPFLHSRHSSGVLVVIGLGLVGNSICQVGRLLGFDVIGSDPLESRRQLAQQCANAATCNPDGIVAIVQERTAGKGACLLADTVVNEGTTTLATEILREGSDYCMIALPKTKMLPNLPAVWSKDIQINSGWEMPLPRQGQNAYGPSTECNLQRAFAWLSSGAFQAQPLITHRITPNEFADIFNKLIKEPQLTNGIIIEWS